jgi:Bacteriocin-protection, YdeI or OmpD-Associated
VPEQLKEKFRNDPRLKRALEALTPGRQRGYLFHFAGAKQSETTSNRCGFIRGAPPIRQSALLDPAQPSNTASTNFESARSIVWLMVSFTALSGAPAGWLHFLQVLARTSRSTPPGLQAAHSW